jgi:cytoskeleton protein RodZ
MVEEQAAATAPEGAGALLRRERESQGLNISDAARALRLSEKQITALEADDYAQLPGRTFVRGFIRNYARLMQLDPEPLMARLSFGQEEESHQIQVPSQKISFSEHQGRPWLKWLMMAFVLVSVVSWGVLQWLGPVQPKSVALPRTVVPVAPLPPAASAPPPLMPAPAVEAPSSVMSPAMPAAVTPAPPVGIPSSGVTLTRLKMSFSGLSWVEVRDRSGKTIHSQNNAAGTDQIVEGEAPLSLVIGNSAKVKLLYKGQPVDLSAFAKDEVARLTLE